MGNDEGVVIPYEYFIPGKEIYAWIVLSDGDDSRITEYEAKIIVDPRAEPSDDEPLPEEQEIITQAINALNTAVSEANDTVSHYPKIIEGYWYVWDVTAGEYVTTGIKSTGEDGYSPTVTVTEITGGHQVTITDENGDHVFNVLDGTHGENGVTFTPSVSSAGVISWTNNGSLPNPESVNIKGPPGDDGVSPSITVTDIPGGHSVTITDADHPQGQTFDVMDGAPGTGISVHICSAAEYDSTTRVPTVQNPDTNTFYLVPAENGASPDMFVEWIYTNNAWELFGSARVEVPVQDVQVNGTSVVTDGVANVPLASNSSLGVVKVNGANGVKVLSDGTLSIEGAGKFNGTIKQGSNLSQPIVPFTQDYAVFYGIAKAAGANMASIASTTVGIYPEAQKSAIHEMFNGPVTVSGSTPVIAALPGIQYVCGEVSTLDITLPASGCIDVVFESGSTATVLTITPPTGVTLKWTNGFDPRALDANTTYEINIADGLGVAGQWT